MTGVLCNDHSILQYPFAVSSPHCQLPDTALAHWCPWPYWRYRIHGVFLFGSKFGGEQRV